MPMLVPQFIVTNLARNQLEGDFYGIAMFIDVSGFTPMVENFMREGKEGAEAISLLLDECFALVIDRVQEQGGFISAFAGDAMLAIFPHLETIRAVEAAWMIQSLFREKKEQKTPFGDCHLSVKIGLSQGPIQWGIVGTLTRKSYYFRGETVKASTKAEKACSPGEILMDDSYFRSLPREGIEAKEKGLFWKLTTCKVESQPLLKEETKIPYQLMDLFFANTHLEDRGEFRDVVSVFLSFPEDLDGEDLLRFIETLIEQVEFFGGTLNLLDFTDKGGLVFLLFGAPISYENNLERAVAFSFEVRLLLQETIKIGLTEGAVYAGLVGGLQRKTYTVLGDPVNTAARIMMASPPNTITTTEEVASRLNSIYHIEKRGEHRLKGKSNIYTLYEIVSPLKKRTHTFFKEDMIERSEAMKDLLDSMGPLWEGAYGGVVYVYGEAGIGKSRLIHESKANLPGNSRTITLLTDSVFQKSLNPFVSFLKEILFKNRPISKKGEFKKLFKNFLDKLPLDDKRALHISKELQRMESIVAALLGIHWEGSLYEELDPKHRYENTLFAMKEVFKALSLLHPTILVLENAQWLDPASKDALTMMTRRLEGFPLLFLVVSRYDDSGNRPCLRLDTTIPQNQIQLKGLSQKGILAFIKRELGAPPTENLISFISKKTQGNPFYMEQICLYLQENHLLKMEGDYYCLREEQVYVPSSIKAILIARLDRLTGELKSGVQIAAVLGQEFDIQVLSSMLQGRDKEFLLSVGVRENIWKSLSEFIYVFHHALLRDAAYEMQLRERLRKLHKIAALAMETLYREDRSRYMDMGYHFEQAQEREKAYEFLLKAAEYAREEYRNEEALYLYDRALSHAHEKSLQIPIQDARGHILQLIGRWNEAIAIFRDNLVEAKALKSSILMAKSYLNLGTILLQKGELQEVQGLLESALKEYQSLQEKKGVVHVLAGLGDLARAKGDNDTARSYYQQELTIAQEIQDQEEISQALGRIGNIHRDRGYYQEARMCYEEKVNICKNIGHRRGLSQAYNNIGTIHQRLGDYEKAMEYFHKVLQICDQLGDKRSRGVVAGNMGILQWHLGNIHEVMEWFQKHLDISEELGDLEGISRATGNMGVIFEQLGDFQRAKECFEKQMKISQEMGARKGIAFGKANIGRMFTLQGEYVKAKEVYGEALSLAYELEDKFLISYNCFQLGLIHQALQDREGAKRWLNEAIHLAEELDSKYELSEYLHTYGSIAFASREYEKAKEMNHKSLELANNVQRKDILFKGRLLEARLLALTEPDEAIEHIEGMLLSSTSKEESATVYFNLYELTEDESYRRKAYEAYSELYENNPRANYLESLKILKD